jgi:hypothetical protein
LASPRSIRRPTFFPDGLAQLFFQLLRAIPQAFLFWGNSMNRAFSRLGFTALALVAGSALYAQSSSTTGSVSGIVLDEAGAPLAGASVTLSSSQVTRTIVTGADGSFRLGLLNPGTWTIKVSSDGFQMQSASVTVSPNDNRAMSFKLPKVGLATVEVFGRTQVVDTTSTAVGQTLNMEEIAAIPNSDRGRDFSGVAFFSPGVAQGGFQANSPSMSGASAAENSYYVDGLDTTNYQFGTQGASLKTDFIDQVQIQTGGFAPEYSALGGVINAITKSGSNDFKGSAWASWDAIGIHAGLKKNDFFQESPAEDSTRYDIGFEVGGAIIKDKLFYFIGADSQYTQGVSTTNLDSGTASGGLTSDKPKDNPIQVVSKLNWYLSQDMQLTWFANYNSEKFTAGAQYPYPAGRANIGVDSTTKNISTNLNYDWTINPSVVFSAKLGYVSLDTKNNPASGNITQVDDYAWYVNGPGTQPGYPGANLTSTQPAFIYGGTGGYSPEVKVVSKQASMSLGVFWGTHSMKFGVSHLESDYTQHDATSGTFQDQIQAWGPGNWRLDRIEFRGGATVKAKFNAVYAQDNWEVMPGLRLIYGFRYESQEQDDYKGVAFVKFNDVGKQTQPRLGFTWDMNNDGKTKVSGSYARYYEKIPQRAAYRTWAPETYLDHIYYVGDGNFTYNQANGAYAITGPQSGLNDYSTPFSYDPVAKDIRLPQRDEVTLGVDHTFESGWTAGVHATYRHLKNPIEDSVILNTSTNAPYSADGHAIWWNPGPSVTWTQTSVSPDAGTTYSVGATGFPTFTNTYEGVILSLDKRTDRDYFSFNYTLSRIYGWYEGVVTASNGQEDGNITASGDSYAYNGYGLQSLNHTNVAKLQYSHRFTVIGGDLNLGFNWSYQTGTPLSRYDNGAYPGGYGDPLGYGNNTPYQQQVGQFGNSPSITTTDMHLDYAINLGGKMRLMPSVDIFNLLNSRAATGINQFATLQFSGGPNTSYGPNAAVIGGAPTVENSWLEGRRFRFGVKFQF